MEYKSIDDYTCTARIGEGGQATVYKAEDNKTKEIVALKVFDKKTCSIEKNVE